ncbi:MAG: indole-3-glycerol phosphate synthase TrpC [Clostridiales bacterium]|jgi:indole-3-glycerol phosphate synthase|nr:indole-3-glycerol phosphate synthase TrpC [Clostridiales bacterium]
MDILSEIAEYTKKRVAVQKERVPLAALERSIAGADGDGKGNGTSRFPFRDALRADGLTFICEIKKASPSKGVISGDFPHLSIAKEYERGAREAGCAAAISVLTEPKYFLGSDKYLEEIAGNVSIPILRKDFVVDEYMIYEAKALGAKAILLICALLSPPIFSSFLNLAHELGLSAICEVRGEGELDMAIGGGAQIIGVNNRDLRTFEVDLQTSVRLREAVPRDKLFVAESGISVRADVALMEKIGADAVLIGETLMRASDKTRKLRELMGV